MKAHLETFGCQMNINETHVIQKKLVEAGYELVPRAEEADLVLLNTCSIREHAESKVVSRLGRLRPLKEDGTIRLLGVTGCMAQRLGGEFLSRVPYLDLVIGSGAYPRFMDVLNARLDSGRPQVDVGYARDFVIEDHPELKPGEVKTFLTIIRGCDNACHYCIVPFTRGPERSKPIGQVVREAEWCASQGYARSPCWGRT